MSLFTWLLRGLFFAALLGTQVIVCHILSGGHALRPWSSTWGMWGLLRHPLFYLWLVLNAAIVAVIPSWYHRGRMTHRASLVLVILPGVWLGAGWFHGWWTHLHTPEPWYAHNIPMLRYFIWEGLDVPQQALCVVNVCLLVLTGCATLIWLRHSSWSPKRSLVGLVWVGCTGGLALWLVPTLDGLGWSILSVSHLLLCLSIACIGQAEPPALSFHNVPGPGWRELDDDKAEPPPQPSPLPLVFTATASLAVTGWLQYIHLIHTLSGPKHRQPFNDSIHTIILQTERLYQTYNTIWDHAQSFLLLASISVLGLCGLFLWWQRETLHTMHYNLQKPFLAAALSVGCALSMAFLYKLSSRQLIFQHAPAPIHGIAHSFTTYHKLSASRFPKQRWSSSRTSRQDSLAGVIFFPAPLLILGSQATVIHLAPQHLVWSQAWRIRRLKLNGKGQFLVSARLSQRKRAQAEQQQIQQLLEARGLSMSRPTKPRRQEAILIVHPEVPSGTMATVLRQAQQVHEQVYLMFAAPQIWESGESSLPVLRHIKLFPVKLLPEQAQRTKASPVQSNLLRVKLSEQGLSLQLSTATGAPQRVSFARHQGVLPWLAIQETLPQIQKQLRRSGRTRRALVPPAEKPHLFTVQLTVTHKQPCYEWALWVLRLSSNTSLAFTN